MGYWASSWRIDEGLRQVTRVVIVNAGTGRHSDFDPFILWARRAGYDVAPSGLSVYVPDGHSFEAILAEWQVDTGGRASP